MPSHIPPAPEALMEHAAFVRSVARAALRGDDLVDDVVQDTMLTALEESHRRRGPLRAWLAGVARNIARNLVRQRAARRRREERAASDEATDGADELVARAEEGRRVVAAVLSLDVPYRSAILLRYYEELPPREVALRLGIPVETARTRIKRGIDKLRSELERTHAQEPGGWRVALLPLLRLPSEGPNAAPALVTGGVMLGKKGIAWAALLLVLVGGGLWLRPWADDEGKAGRDEGATLSSDRADPRRPRLRGLPAEAVRPSTDWPAPIDFARVDRDRDLHGWVVRADGSPVAGASVMAVFYPWRTLGVLTSYDRMLTSEKGPSAASAVDGSFNLPLARGDLVALRVRARGFAPTEMAYLQAGERVRVVVAESVRLIVDATDAGGEPVVGMPVRFFVNPERAGHCLEATATTGTDGRAVFADLPPSLKGWIDPAPHREGLGNPGWLDIELPASGEKVHRLQLAAGKTLHGRVLHSETGAPIEGARVSTNWALLPSVLTDPEGNYVLHGWTKELGSHLHATARGFVHSAVELAEAGIPDIRLKPGVTLRGRVVDERGEVVAGALVSVTRIGGGATPLMGSAETDAGGRFVVDGLDVAARLVVVSSRGRGRLVQAIAPGAKEDLGDLVLPARCEVTGSLTDPAGAPMARIPVTLTPSEDFDRALRRLERWTDDIGRFRFPDLGPASYDLGVGPRLDPILRRRIALTAEQPSVDLQLSGKETRSVVVRAVDTAGHPVSGVRFQARTRDPSDVRSSAAPTGEDGHLTLELLRRPYKLFVLGTAAQGIAIPRPIELDAVQTNVDVVIERLEAIRGRLVRPDGTPIAWGRILVAGDGDQATYVSSDGGVFVAYVSAGARVSLAFQGTVENTMGRIHGFVPYTAHLDDVVAGAEDVVLRTTALDMHRRLTIRVVDPTGRPASGVGLSMVVPVNELKPAVTGVDGRATWAGLPALPIAPMISSWRATREQPWIQPAFERVTPAGQELTVRFRQGSVVEGTVLKDDGRPAPLAFVQILEDGKAVRGALADADGRFVAILDPDWSGKVSLQCTATGPGGRPKLSAVEQVQLGHAPVTLQLQADD